MEDVTLPTATLADVLRWRIGVWEQAAREAGVDIGRGGQREIARRAGIAHTTLNALVNGRADWHITAGTAVQLGRVLGISPRALLDVELDDELRKTTGGEDQER